MWFGAAKSGDAQGSQLGGVGSERSLWVQLQGVGCSFGGPELPQPRALLWGLRGL